MGYALKYCLDLGYALAAGGAFTAGFLLGEVHEEARDLDHAGIVTHDDKTAGADNGADLFGRFKVERQVEVLLSQTAAGRAADLNGFELAVFHAAADIKYDLAQGRAHGDLDKSGVLYVAGQGEGLGAGAGLGADAAVPCRAALDNRRNVCKGLNVIERCRSVEQAVINASGRLGTGHSAPAFDGGGQCRTLAADECACAAIYAQSEVFARTEYVIAQQTVSLVISDRHFKTLDCQRILRTDIDVAFLGAGGYAGNYHALDHPVRITFHYGAVHKCAGVALIAVADDVLHGSVLVSCNLRPLFAGGEARAASAAQTRLRYLGNYLVRSHVKQRLFKCGISAFGYIFLGTLGVYMAAVLEGDVKLLFVKRYVLLMNVAFAFFTVEKAVYDLVTENGFFDYLLAVINRNLCIHKAHRLYTHQRPHLAESEAAASLETDRFLVTFVLKFNIDTKSALMQQLFHPAVNVHRAAGNTAGAAADKHLLVLTFKRFPVVLTALCEMLSVFNPHVTQPPLTSE